MPNQITPENLKFKGIILRVYYPFDEDFDKDTGKLINTASDRPMHYGILVKISRYDDNTCSAIIIPGTSKKIKFKETGKVVVHPDVLCVYSNTSLTQITKFVIKPSNVMILKLGSTHFPSFDNSTGTLSINDKGYLSQADIDRVTEYLSNPEIMLLLNDLLSKQEGTIPENDWDDTKYIPANPYID